MIVKDVIKQVAINLGLNDLLETTALDGEQTITEEEQCEINKLISCCNLVVNQIASEYVTLKDEVKLTSNTGTIAYSKITNKILVDILSVKKNGAYVKFNCKPTNLETVEGELEIEFAYQPNMATSISSQIDFNDFKINSRVIAYGVTAEYCFINSMYDDAAIWDNRFKNSLINVLRPRREIKIKKRLWV